jgi:hypothetical protein
MIRGATKPKIDYHLLTEPRIVRDNFREETCRRVDIHTNPEHRMTGFRFPGLRSVDHNQSAAQKRGNNLGIRRLT